MTGSRLYRRFKEFGGLRLIITFTRMGIVGTAIKAVYSCIIKRNPIKAAYPKIIESVERKLSKQYKPLLVKTIEKYYAKGAVCYDQSKEVPKIIWTCWLQGYKQAPVLVKRCMASQKKNFPEYDYRLLTLENFAEWVKLPKFILEKYRAGRIPNALFSDLIRLSVLKKYGGIWMDATVFCSGFGHENLRSRWDKIEKNDLTLFRFFIRGQKQPVGLSNWFIAAKPQHVVISTVFDMLLAYWRDYDCTVDYFIMHLFLDMTFKAMPETIAEMPRENSYHSLMLASVLSKPYNDEWWQDVKAHVFIHKLNYRKETEAAKVHNSFYNSIINR